MKYISKPFKQFISISAASRKVEALKVQYFDSGIVRGKFLVTCLYTVDKLSRNPGSSKGQYEIV